MTPTPLGWAMLGCVPFVNVHVTSNNNTVDKVSTSRPNLFLVGAMKSATTYLAGLLREHPAIFMSSPKEPCYFVEPRVLRKVWPYMWERGYWRSVERYLELFAGAGDAQVIGEASTTYAKAPLFSGVPQRILEFSPDARFIYVMRDPVERAISHYWHRVRFWGERRSLVAAIHSDPQYVDVSHYAMQLGQYLRHVSRERIYVLTYEDLLADSAGQVGRIYSWLGIDPSFHPTLDVPTNFMPEVLDQVRGSGTLERMRQSAAYGKIQPYLPELFRKMGVRLALRQVRPAAVPSETSKEYLRNMLRPRTEELCCLLNRTVPEWTSLNGLGLQRPLMSHQGQQEGEDRSVRLIGS